MISSVARRALQVAAVLAGFVTLAGALLVWRLHHAPIELPFLAPRLEKTLAEIAPGALARVERAELAWAGRRPVIRVFDLRLLERDGTPIASLPGLSLRPSLRAALHGRLASAWIGLTGVRLALVRNPDGAFALDTRAGDGGAGSDETAKLLARLFSKHENADTTTYLSRVDVRGAHLDLDDRAADVRWRAEDAEISLGFAPQRLSIRLQGVLALQSDSDPFVRAARLPLAATADVVLGQTGVLKDLYFELHADQGDFVSPADLEKPLAVDRLDVQGSYSADASVVALQRLHVARGATRLDATARIPLGTSGTVEADGMLRSLPADDLVGYWPPSIHQRTRGWIAEHIRDGQVARCGFRLRVPRDRGPGPLAAEAVDIRFEFEGLTVAFLKHFEPLQDAQGAATLTGTRFVADVRSAASAGLNLHDGRIDIDLTAHPAEATIAARVTGATPDMLAVIDQPPLDIPKKLGIAPAQAGGEGDVKLGLRLPLAPGTTSKDVRVTADAALHNASHSDLLYGIAIQDGDLRVGVDDGRVSISGDTLVAGMPLVAGRTHADFVVEPPGVTRRVSGMLSGGTFVADGTLTFGPSGLQDAVFSTLKVGRTDARARLIRDAGGHCTVSLTGDVLDVEPFFEHSRQDDGKPSRFPRPEWTLDIAVKRLLTGRDLELAYVDAHARGSAAHVEELHAAGALGGGGAFQADFTTAGEQSRFNVTTDNGGKALKALGIDLHVKGGRLLLGGTVEGPEASRTVSGELELNDFRVVEAPILAEILNLGSLEGIASVLRRDGIAFTHARVPFLWSRAGFELREARAVGGIGLTGEGAVDSESGELDITGQVIPAYTLNSALGRIPLIGTLLVGGEGQGVFGINYSVAGKRDKPEISVNPLSALAPGILRQMFVDPFTHKPEALKHAPAAPPAE